MVDPERVRELALALADVSQAPHWHRIAFRTPRKMFATLDPEAHDLNFMFDPDHRDFYCEAAPHAFSPVPGGWGLRGATRCDLRLVDEDTMMSAMRAAYALAAPRASRRASKS